MVDPQHLEFGSAEGGLDTRRVGESCEVVAVEDVVQVWSEPSPDAELVELVGTLRRRDVVVAQSVCDVDGRYLELAVHVLPGLWVRRPGPGGKEEVGDEWKRLGGCGGWIHGRWVIDAQETWVLCAISNSQPVVSMCRAPSAVLRYRVAQPGVASHTCPHPKGDVVKMHQVNDQLEVAEELPGGWVRHIRWRQGAAGNGPAFQSWFARTEFLEFQTWAHASCMPSDDAGNTFSRETTTKGEAKHRKRRAERARAGAATAAKAIENVGPLYAAELSVTADLIMVFARPSLSSLVLGVLRKHDVIVAGQGEHGRPLPDFLCVQAGTWVRRPRERENLFQLAHSCWIRRTLLGTSHEVVSRVGFNEVLRFEVMCPHLAEYTCMSTNNEAVLQVWTQGEVVEEAAEELPGGWVHIVRDRSGIEYCTDKGAARSSPPTRSSYILSRHGTSDPCLRRLAWLAREDFQTTGESPVALQVLEGLQLPGEVQAPRDLQAPGEATDMVQALVDLQLQGEAEDMVEAHKDLPSPGQATDEAQVAVNVTLEERQPSPEQTPDHEAPAELPPREETSDEAPVDLLPSGEATPKASDAHVGVAGPQPPWPDDQSADAQGQVCAPQPPLADTQGMAAQGEAGAPQPLQAENQGSAAQGEAGAEKLAGSDAQVADAQGEACGLRPPLVDAQGTAAQGEKGATRPFRADDHGVDAQGEAGAPQQRGADAHAADAQGEACALQPPPADAQEKAAQGQAGAPQQLRADDHGAGAQGEAGASQPAGADAQAADAQQGTSVPQLPGLDAHRVDVQGGQSAPEAMPDAGRATTPSDVAIRRPAAYYGICDLKYDKRRMPGQRVHLLELGSGRLSRFSGHGEHIPRRFQENYKLCRQLDRSVLVDNKKLTHDIFLECSLRHLRPKQAYFPRIYTTDLARKIAEQLRNGNELGVCTVPVVLKLLNRCRGAGVIVAHPGEDLDAALRLLLTPTEKYFSANAKSMLRAALSSDPDSMDEHCLHWWSNECPVFVAERCEVSHPIRTERAGQWEDYDATMRVGFVLMRNDDGTEPQLTAEFLGGYWKLPSEPTTSADVRARCVSKARSGTLPVESDDLEGVYRELRHALPKVYCFETCSVGASIKRYGNDPLLFSYTLARHAAGQLQREAQVKSRALASGKPVPAQNRNTLTFLDMAKGRLANMSVEHAPIKRWESMLDQPLPTRVVAAYIERQFGIAEANSDRWDNAETHFRRALKLHRWNATAEYLVGLWHLRMCEYAVAQNSFVRSVRLDPEFKASYVNLAFAAIAQKSYDNAASVSAAGLKRHPQAFQCSYNLGLALAFQLLHGLRMAKPGNERFAPTPLPDSELGPLARQSGMELRQAKEQKEQIKTAWSENDDVLLERMELLGRQLADGSAYVKQWIPLLEESLHDAHGWQLINFRP